MASLYTKFLDFIGIEESDDIDDERDDDYYRDEPVERDRGRDRDRDRDRDREDNVVTFGVGRRDNKRHEARSSAVQREQTSGANLPISGGMKMIVYHPVSYEDTQIIIDNLKNRKPVIVNMEDLDVDCAQRILDFLSGAIYALGGTMCKISRGIFVVAPNNYDVVGNNDDYGDM